ncbi:MAG: sulfatase-like hydrolase/transferase [Anaerohalosphaera sp.]|nr:sulfatase-like hydrolase/transferase [Anaerohalosphaera sp.]
MDRRDFIKTIGVGAAGFTMGGCGSLEVSTNRKANRKPNIILVMADDQGWGDMGYNGHPVLKTPNFDAMAAEGLRFDRFYAAAPVCSPTRGSVMTGRHPNRFGCFKWGYTLRPQEITVAEALKSAGYVTGHFGKWHIGSMLEYGQASPGKSGFDEWLSAANFFDNDPVLSREGKAVEMKGESSLVTVDAAIEFIRKHEGGSKPVFAVVWFGSPHNPHIAGEGFGQAYADQGKKKNFYGEIAGMDSAVGKLRSEIRNLGIEKDTLVWYCSDNGGLPNLGVTGGRGHKGQIYEGGLRVPAIMEWPRRIGTPAVTQVPCNTVDIYPTVLEIAGVKMKDQPVLDGVSLAGVIDGTMKYRPRPMGFWDYPIKGLGTPSDAWMKEVLEAQRKGEKITDPAKLCSDAGKITKQYPTDSFPGHAAWLDWPWKLHRIEDKNGKVKLELYNLADDSYEKTDLVTEQTERTETMRARLQEWQASVVRSLNGEDYDSN